MSDLKILTVFIPGAAKSKGSMEHRGGGQLKESVRGSTEWKRVMAQVLATEYAKWYREPMTRAIGVYGHFWLPVATYDALLAERARGNYDLDKLIRNLGDAATEAKVWKDDAQVVLWNVGKAPADGAHSQGVEITIRELR